MDRPNFVEGVKALASNITRNLVLAGHAITFNLKSLKIEDLPKLEQELQDRTYIQIR